jgi:hypothetical protein
MPATSRDRPHPLFDPTSLYRLGSELSVWSVDPGSDEPAGAGSIRCYFEALRLKDLEERWADALPMERRNPDEWDWGHDKETNLRIFEQKSRQGRSGWNEWWFPPASGISVPPTAEPQQQKLVGYGAPGDPFELPALIRYDLRTLPPVRPKNAAQSPEWMFTGLSKAERRTHPTIQEFEVNIHIAEAEGCDCIVLLLTRGQVEQLAGLLERGDDPTTPTESLPRRKVETPDETIDVITEALHPWRLEPGNESPEGRQWLASRLSLVLSCAPGLAGVVRDSLFHRQVVLAPPENPARTFPHLPGTTWMVFCLGDRRT